MSELYNLFPIPPWLTLVILVVVAMVILYLGRQPAHGAIQTVFHGLYSALRLMARSLSLAERRLQQRNREVLLELGREQVERELQREFFRINKFVERDLGGYPKLQRVVQEQVQVIEEDYRDSAEVPPPSPEWIQAVEAVAKLQVNEKGHGLVAKILEDIHHASEEQHRDNLQAYRQSVSERHGLLKRMLPYWRKVANNIEDLGKHLNEVLKRAKHIDDQMARFEKISTGDARAERMLKASAVTQFSIALLVVLIAVGGAFFNFHLIALPMSEMVGAANRIAGVKVADLSALVIVLLEVTMGIFLMEALGITKMFPIIGAMDDRMRKRMAWAFGIILVTLASVESGLAFMREQIAEDLSALRSSLAGGEDAPAEAMQSWIPLAANMTMGFVLPLALTIVAIPLEYLFHTSRTVFGVLVEWLLRVGYVVMRVVGNICLHLGRLLIQLYDWLIILPLWLERQFAAPRLRRLEQAALDAPEQQALDAPEPPASNS